MGAITIIFSWVNALIAVPRASPQACKGAHILLKAKEKREQRGRKREREALKALQNAKNSYYPSKVAEEWHNIPFSLSLSLSLPPPTLICSLFLSTRLSGFLSLSHSLLALSLSPYHLITT